MSENFQKIIILRQAFPRSKQAKIKEMSERIARNVARKEGRETKLVDGKIRKMVMAKSKNASTKSPHLLGLAAMIKGPTKK